MKKIKFIHAADLHLDSPMTGLKHLPAEILKRLRESSFKALSNIVVTALEKEADFVIFAGDIFDGEDRSLRAQARFRKEMEKLQAKNIPVYIVHGNHDHLGGTWVRFDLPENVHVFGPEVEMKKLTTRTGARVHLYGFSYPIRHVLERKIDDYIKMEGADYHIGILHGHGGSSTDHGVYAPFLIKDLIDKKFHYWALGHIHKRSVLSNDPPIVYPGNIQGRHKKETGMKGCYLVELDELYSEYEFYPSSDVLWETVEIDVSSAKHFQDVYQLCRTELERYQNGQKGTLLLLNLKNLKLNDSSIMAQEATGLLEMLQDTAPQEDGFVWPVELSFQQEKSESRTELTRKNDFYKELFEELDSESNIPEVLEPLYRDHSIGRKLLMAPNENEMKIIKEEAERILLRLLNP